MHATLLEIDGWMDHMAKWTDVVDAERKMQTAIKQRDAIANDAEKFREYLRETGQVDAYMEWYARRLGLHEALYGDAA